MTRYALVMIAAVSIALTASAQQPPMLQQPALPRPTISPYLNLLRGGSGALNYFGLVKPQQDARRALNNLQNQVTTLQNNTNSAYTGAGAGNELVTGKQVGYFTHTGYFMNMGGLNNARPVGTPMGNAGNNTLFQNQPQGQGQGQNSLMPFNR